MGIILEPDGVDFVVQSKALTKKQEMELSKFIAKRKIEIKLQAIQRKSTRKKDKTIIV